MSEYPGRLARVVSFCTTMLRAIAMFIIGATAFGVVRLVTGSKVEVARVSAEMSAALVRLRLLHSPFRWLVSLYDRFVQPFAPAGHSAEVLSGLRADRRERACECRECTPQDRSTKSGGAGLR